MEGYFLTTYNSLCNDIDYYRARLYSISKEYTYWYRMMRDPFPPYAPLDVCAEKIDNLKECYNMVEDILKAKEAEKEKLENYMSSDNLYYKVACLRYYKKLTLKEIADLLGYSYGHIKKVSSKLSKMQLLCNPNNEQMVL